MAIESQLAMIKQNPAIWNKWRAENPDEPINLNGADFSGADLSGADLSGADLSDADLSGCLLAGASISQTNLSKANLSNADLSNAHLDNSNLKKALLIDTKLTGSSLIEAFLLQADLSGADLSNADLSEACLQGADLSGTDFTKANLTGAQLGETIIEAAIFTEAVLINTNFNNAKGNGTNFYRADLGSTQMLNVILKNADFSDTFLRDSCFCSADLTGAIFKRANLIASDFSSAILINANFTQADLTEAKLNHADLEEANLSGANLQKTVLIETNFNNAILSNCRVYGISAWDIMGTPKDQSNLVITQDSFFLFSEDNLRDSNIDKNGAITVDDLQVAQFIYLLLNRKNIRNVIDTITSKAVLILGRFTPERKKILDAMADELRKNNLLPIIFDFEKPTDRDFTETIKTLAGISLFIIADITSPKSSPLELQAIVPDYQIPLVPVIQAGEEPFSMLSDLIGKHDWVLSPVIKYASVTELTAGFKVAVIDRAWNKHQELQKKKTATIETQSIEDFIGNTIR